VFRRDDVDLLEDQLEDLYERYQGDTRGERSMEQEVLQEQVQTEEVSDQELSITLGEQLFESVHKHQEHTVPSGGEMDFEQEDEPLIPTQQRDPLYLEARAWSVPVFAFAQQRYLQKDTRGREVFRIYVNTNLIPIKLSTAIQEECLDDGFAHEIALKEYELTCTYLERVLEDLVILFETGEGRPALQQMIIGGKRLLRLVRGRHALLKRQRRFL